VLLPSVAQAQGDEAPAADPEQTKACVQSFDRAQELRRDGKLVAARKELVACALPHCPDVVERKCSEWLDEVDKTLPTVAIVVEGTSEQVQVFVDGEKVDPASLGRATGMDPGPHQVRVEVAGRPPVEQRIVVAEGERNRIVRIDLAASAGPQPDPPPTPTAPKPTEPSEGESSGISPLVWVGFGVAAAGLLVGGITGGVALSKGGEIDDACPDGKCTEEQRDTYDSGMTMAHVSTASFAVAGVGVVVGIVGLLLPSKSEEQTTETGWQLEPLIGPGTLGLRGRF